MFNCFDGESHGGADGVERLLEQRGAYRAFSRAVQAPGEVSVAAMSASPTARAPSSPCPSGGPCAGWRASLLRESDDAMLALWCRLEGAAEAWQSNNACLAAKISWWKYVTYDFDAICVSAFFPIPFVASVLCPPPTTFS